MTKYGRMIGLWAMAMSIIIMAVSCSNGGQSSSNNNANNGSNGTLKCEQDTQAVGGLLGECVQVSPANNLTVNTADTNITIENTTSYAPFTKKMETYGTMFVARADVSDTFMTDVAKAYQQMFPQLNSLDLTKQQEVLNHIQRYRGVITMHANSSNVANNDNLQQNCSLCDIISMGEAKQTMEVVEHLLHNITDVGLHYGYPDQWSFNKTSSQIYVVMKEAINKGYYNVSTYDEILTSSSCGTYNRVLVQEFGYWLITTYWNLQEPYGPNENEWTIRNRTQLQNLLPSGVTLLENTVNKIMEVPSSEILTKLSTY